MTAESISSKTHSEQARSRVGGPHASEAPGGQTASLAPARRNPLADQARSWLNDEIIPWWTENAWDQEFGGFHEAFDANLNPITTEGKRCFVQARQVAVFASLKKPEMANRGWEWMKDRYLDYGDGLWRHKISREGKPLPETTIRSRYDQAFVVFAIANLTKFGSATFSEGAEIHYLTQGMPLEYQQNPDMHELESCLAMLDAGGCAGWGANARNIIEIAQRAFVVDGFLREHFTDDWRPDPERGHIVMPGHHFEWVWLIYEYRRLTGDETFDGLANSLYWNGVTMTHGDAVPHTIKIGESGQWVYDGRRRLWPQCEAVRAHAVMAKAQYKFLNAHEFAIGTLTTILRDHRNGPVWHEWLSPAGVPIGGGRVPASSLYHLVGALNVALEAMDGSE